MNLKEAYNLVVGHENLENNVIRKKIWKHKLWPKISIFIWPSASGTTLTWDKLTKRGFQGPCCYHLCIEAKETTENLSYQFPLGHILWDQGEITFKQYQNCHSLINTTANSRFQYFSNLILNRVWKLFPSFLL